MKKKQAKKKIKLINIPKMPKSFNVINKGIDKLRMPVVKKNPAMK